MRSFDKLSNLTQKGPLGSPIARLWHSLHSHHWDPHRFALLVGEIPVHADEIACTFHPPKREARAGELLRCRKGRLGRVPTRVDRPAAPRSTATPRARSSSLDSSITDSRTWRPGAT